MGQTPCGSPRSLESLTRVQELMESIFCRAAVGWIGHGSWGDMSEEEPKKQGVHAGSHAGDHVF